MSKLRGAVVVVNYASTGLLHCNLVPLGEVAQVVVVDNFSSLEERSGVDELARQQGWELVHADNRGFAAGVNVGVARARALGCDVVLLQNPDVSVRPDVVVALLDQAGQAPDALVSPALRGVDGQDLPVLGTLDLSRGTTRTRGVLEPGLERWMTAACLAMSVALWERLGGLDEDYFMYWEDVDLSHRCLAIGGRFVVRPDLVATHEVGGTQGTGKSSLYRYYNCRNRLLFARRHLARRRALRWALHTPIYAYRVLLRSGRRPLVQRPLRTIAPVLLGSAAGLRVVLVGR